MALPNDSVSMALFCDFENVALGVRDAKYEKFDIKPVLERLLLKGSIVVKKAYCDWDRYKGFKAAMHEASFELIEIPHVRQTGKNSADIRLVVDALDLCYTKSHVDTFVIISGDSDFSPLVSKLRENAKKVIGVGVKNSTSDLLVANCDEFIFYDDLVREQQRAQAKRDAATRKNDEDRAPRQKPGKQDSPEVEARKEKAFALAVETFDALVTERGDSNKIWASVLKEAIKRRRPDFNESYFGFRAFGGLLDEAQARGLFEVGRDEKSGTYVFRSAQDIGSRLEEPPASAAPAPQSPNRGARQDFAASQDANVADEGSLGTQRSAAPRSNEAVTADRAPAKKSRRRGRDRDRGRDANNERDPGSDRGRRDAESVVEVDQGAFAEDANTATTADTVLAIIDAPYGDAGDAFADDAPLTADATGTSKSPEAADARTHGAEAGLFDEDTSDTLTSAPVASDSAHYLAADRDADALSLGERPRPGKASAARRARRAPSKRASTVVTEMLELDSEAPLEIATPSADTLAVNVSSVVPPSTVAVAASTPDEEVDAVTPTAEAAPAKRGRRPGASARRARKTPQLFPEE
ncbi:NYN domain-containing protein [Robbsia andropogonis]|uniref:NYN domain-containing protein n=1 Tax=Robbsia andropogonis TaxID=28092 RepID=UPI000464B9E1|nr:NYN domain-containing protein [Robbsia andropogonis]MCP1120747.1 NYN domain-containing protein [Robbsia andropogonis]MCP1130578.1 NYN domain-containing protein [Robbsia andropogonis]